MPIVKDAIQAFVRRNITAMATAAKTLPIGRKAAPLLLFARRFDADMGFPSPFTWPRLRRRTETRKDSREEALLPNGMSREWEMSNLPCLTPSTLLTRPENRPTVPVIDRL